MRVGPGTLSFLLHSLLCCTAWHWSSGSCAVLRQGGVELLVDLLPSFADEVHDPKYIVAVDLDGGGEASKDPADGHLTMTDRTGRRFCCDLPANASDGSDAERGGPERPGQVAGGDRRPSELLEALDGLCFYRVEDWWTYELCYKKAVRQFHKEGEALTAEFRLGTFDPGASDLDRVQHDTAAAPADAKAAAQVYSGGEPCDVTGAPRRTEVRFGCGEAAGRDALSGLREPATCSYVLHLATPRLCGHPAFRVAEPPVRAILCSPLRPDGAAPAAAGPRDAAEQGPKEHVREGIAARGAGREDSTGAPGGDAGAVEAGRGSEQWSSQEGEAEAAEQSRVDLERAQPLRKQRPPGRDGEL